MRVSSTKPPPVPPAPVVLQPFDPRWTELFEAESARVREALGSLVDGGTLDELEHMGSTSVPGLWAKPTIDMLGRIHPYPPGDAEIEALAAIGYTWRGEYGLPGRTYFTKGPHDYHLHLVGFDTEHWERHLVFRNFLRENPDAKSRYERLKQELAVRFRDDRPAYQDGKTELVTALNREAAAWHVAATGFAPVERLRNVFAGMPDDGSWAVSGGWALALHLGAPERYHEDIDLEIDSARKLAVQEYLLAEGWRLDQLVEGGRYAPWPLGEPLGNASQQVHARHGSEFIEITFAERGPDAWVYQGRPTVTLLLSAAIKRAALPSGTAVPYLAPELVLLLKSRLRGSQADAKPREKDTADLARILPTLDAAAREWLAAALRLVHGEHPWLGSL